MSSRDKDTTKADVSYLENWGADFADDIKLLEMIYNGIHYKDSRRTGSDRARKNADFTTSIVAKLTKDLTILLVRRHMSSNDKKTIR